MKHLTKKRTYERLLRNIARDMAALRPDAEPARREYLNKKFAKYAEKAGIDLKNGPTGNTNN